MFLFKHTRHLFFCIISQQKAAAMFQFCRDSLCQRIQVRIDKYSDLNQANLSALAEMMMAQAIECYYEKANDGKSSNH